MNKWIMGFDKKIVTPSDYKEVSYYSAGYAGGCRCTDVLDDTGCYAARTILDASALILKIFNSKE